MGACSCYSEQLQSQFNTTPVKVEAKAIEREQPKLESVSSSTHASNEPNKNSVKELEQFPQLSKTIEEVDEKLGDFLPDVEKLQDSDRGQPISKTYKLRSKLIYQGEWKGGKIHGFGRFLLPDGSYLRCRSNENFGEGKCRMIRPNGDYYEGEIKYFKANGEGRYRQCSITYQGEFQNNQPHGMGKQIGSYQFGERVDGTLMWNFKASTPSLYKGTFFENSFHGFGTLITSKGQYEGEFLRGMKNGYGTFVWKNQAKFEGRYHNDKKNGQGRMYNPRGQLVIAGKWIDDRVPETQQYYF